MGRQLLPTHPPTWEAPLASKFGTNWGWSPDVQTGPATVGQDLIATESANPGWLSWCKDPPSRRAAHPDCGQAGEEVQLLAAN